MPLHFTSLNSGSNGNCYYVGNDTEAVLIDAGLSCKETERRMSEIGLQIKLVKAIFVSHEHTDHIRGLGGLADKYGMPIYVSEATQKGCYHLQPEHVIHLTEYKQVCIGKLCITAFKKIHDAADPHSFTVTSQGITVGVFTDIGRVCTNLITHFKLCNAAFLEANYDTDRLANGRYPHFLKQRITGGKGHLSNAEALAFCKLYKPTHMSHLLLAHLSKDNNCPVLVHKLFSAIAGHTKIWVASRDNAMPLLTIGEGINAKKMLRSIDNNNLQLSLF